MNPVTLYQLSLLVQEDKLREAVHHRRAREAQANRTARRPGLGRQLRRLMPWPALKMAQQEQA